MIFEMLMCPVPLWAHTTCLVPWNLAEKIHRGEGRYVAFNLIDFVDSIGGIYVLVEFNILPFTKSYDSLDARMCCTAVRAHNALGAVKSCWEDAPRLRAVRPFKVGWLCWLCWWYVLVAFHIWHFTKSYDTWYSRYPYVLSSGRLVGTMAVEYYAISM